MTPIDRGSDRPAYKQIADELRDRILAGELTEGAQLPSERELSDEYETSRVTVRQAIAILRNEGLITVKQGTGVFVRLRRPLPRRNPSRLTSDARADNRSAFTGDALLSDYVPSVQVAITTAPASEVVAKALHIQSGAAVTVRDRVMSVDGEPVQLATSFYDHGLAAGTPIEIPDTGPGGVHARLTDLGREPVRFTETLTARMPEPDAARLLHLDGGIPVIRIIRVAYDVRDRPVEFTDMTLAADRYELTYEFRS